MGLIVPGRLGARHSKAPVAVSSLAQRASLSRYVAPSAVDWSIKCPADGRDLGNNEHGCCVEAAIYRAIECRLANIWGGGFTPQTYEVLGLYARLTGFNPATGLPDEGTDTVQAMTSWATKGVTWGPYPTLDVSLWAHVDPSNDDHVASALAMAGPVQITLALPSMAQVIERWSQAPGNGAGWEPASWGYHRVCGVGYSGLIRTVRTWGNDVPVHPEFWKAYVVAVDVPLSREWLNITGRTWSGLDWEGLVNDMARLSA